MYQVNPLVNLYRPTKNADVLYSLAIGNIPFILESTLTLTQRTFKEGSLTNDMILKLVNGEQVSSVAIYDSTQSRVRKMIEKSSCLGWEVKIVMLAHDDGQCG